ncbi:hypothetical protein CQW49_05820 [Methylosinus trichosporium OB3b]|uniref:Uncharacterized protein n=1 Tax=Methylosinus trichosporium (strain ATCC 35070 / NCIMB 11131 / UNIQEM 75 / OB3b) TaxID=595536 RepID=A0A2D2CXN3_METT3|nr:hypothetical protein CQW49_05820 [Methylosinus trichosporium OB3b]OBS50875.1 hypothetical protein A8B73_19110 [Methylosinus sp. 3S-1]
MVHTASTSDRSVWNLRHPSVDHRRLPRSIRSFQLSDQCQPIESPYACLADPIGQEYGADATRRFGALRMNILHPHANDLFFTTTERPSSWMLARGEFAERLISVNNLFTRDAHCIEPSSAFV